MPRSSIGPPANAPAATRLTTDQIDRWAERIAAGRDEFPADLTDPDRISLAAAVRVRLRDRLVRLVARSVAERMLRGGPATNE
jgi:hypothetical protein